MGELSGLSQMTWLGNNWTTATTNAITLSSPYQYGGSVAFQQAKPRTNLDWLDERVNEMRVKL